MNFCARKCRRNLCAAQPAALEEWSLQGCQAGVSWPRLGEPALHIPQVYPVCPHWECRAGVLASRVGSGGVPCAEWVSVSPTRLPWQWGTGGSVPRECHCHLSRLGQSPGLPTLEF